MQQPQQPTTAPDLFGGAQEAVWVPELGQYLLAPGTGVLNSQDFVPPQHQMGPDPMAGTLSNHFHKLNSQILEHFDRLFQNNVRFVDKKYTIFFSFNKQAAHPHSRLSIITRRPLCSTWTTSPPRALSSTLTVSFLQIILFYFTFSHFRTRFRKSNAS